MRRRLVAGAGVGAVAAGVVTLVSAGQAALSAADALDDARADLAAVASGGADVTETATALRRAQQRVGAAQDVLGRWSVDVVAAVPVVGRSWDAERAVARTAAEVVAGGSVLAEQLPTVAAGRGGVDLAALEQVRAAVAGPARRADDALQHLRRTPVRLTPPQVGDGVAEAVDALAPAVEALARAESAAGVASGLLGADGPRSVLLMLQNNAELRGAGGYAASFATGRLQDGRLELDPLRDVIAVADPPAQARRVPAPEEYLEDFGPLSGNTTIWRSWNMSPHVPDSALVGARVAGALLGEEPDVVVLLDVPSLAALAALDGGSIALPDGSTATADQLTDALLVDAYADAGADGDAQDRRRAALQQAATAAVGQLLAGNVPAAEAARTVARLAAERHLAVWSARPQEQAALEDLGAAGSVLPAPGGDLSHVSVNNLGSNKLDLYVDRDLATDVVVGRDEAQVVQRARFTNHAPDKLVPYVAGAERPGVAVSRVELSLPPEATGIVGSIDGRPWSGSLHTGPSRQRLSTVLEIPRGSSAVVEARYSLPLQDGQYRLRLVPQPLVEDAHLALSVTPAAGQRLGEVDGAPSDGEVVREQAPLTATREVTAALAPARQERSRWQRFRDWWSSPLEIGGGGGQ